MPPEEIGAHGRVPGQPDRRRAPVVDREHRPVRPQDPRAPPGCSTPSSTSTYNATVRDFWRGPRARSGPTTVTCQAWDADGSVTPYAGLVDEILAATATARRRRPPAHDPAERDAHVVPVPPLLRHPGRATRTPAPTCSPTAACCSCAAFSKFGAVRLPVEHRRRGRGSRTPPCSRAFVLRDVSVRVTDFGTSVTDPEDYLPHVEEVAWFSTAGGAARADRRGGTGPRSSRPAKAAQRGALPPRRRR